MLVLLSKHGLIHGGLFVSDPSKFKSVPPVQDVGSFP